MERPPYKVWEDVTFVLHLVFANPHLQAPLLPNKYDSFRGPFIDGPRLRGCVMRRGSFTRSQYPVQRWKEESLEVLIVARISIEIDT